MSLQVYQRLLNQYEESQYGNFLVTKLLQMKTVNTPSAKTAFDTMKEEAYYRLEWCRLPSDTSKTTFVVFLWSMQISISMSCRQNRWRFILGCSRRYSILLFPMIAWNRGEAIKLNQIPDGALVQVDNASWRQTTVSLNLFSHCCKRQQESHWTIDGGMYDLLDFLVHCRLQISYPNNLCPIICLVHGMFWLRVRSYQCSTLLMI